MELPRATRPAGSPIRPRKAVSARRVVEWKRVRGGHGEARGSRPHAIPTQTSLTPGAGRDTHGIEVNPSEQHRR